MNDSGDVAWTGNNTIYVGQNPRTGEVIGVGDPLDGSTVAFLGLPRINNLGQVGFPARLSNGRMGLYIATPIPEPATWALIAAAAMAPLIRRRPRTVSFGYMRNASRSTSAV